MPAGTNKLIILRSSTWLEQLDPIVWKLPSLRNSRQPPSVPAGVRVYAVGDVHGRADLLTPLLSQIEVDIALHPISRPIVVFLGDYIDRGPSSKEVLDLLTNNDHTHEMVFLKGNHEVFLLKFLDHSEILEDWRQCGGLETLISFGIKPPINPAPFERARLAHGLNGVLTDAHREFLETLKLTFLCGDFLFVHAGLRPLVPLQEQKEDDLLWIRDDFLLWDKEFEKIIVHGHTPVHEPDVRFNRINIDTGAFATGRLTCMTIEGAEITPLIDVRDWVRELPGTGLSRSEPIVQNPSLVAAIHAKKLKQDLALYDKDSLARLDPRPQRIRTDVPHDQIR
jgi:serine/threonine protein phosphatase 1